MHIRLYKRGAPAVDERDQRDLIRYRNPVGLVEELEPIAVSASAARLLDQRVEVGIRIPAGVCERVRVEQ